MRRSLDTRLQALEARAAWHAPLAAFGTGPVAERLALLLRPADPSRAGDNAIVARLVDRLAEAGRDHAQPADVQAIVAELFPAPEHAEAARILTRLFEFPETPHEHTT
ncbi:MAG TPA: hypothetical protein PK144_18195 [Plasticicumulans sp.]|nr:hypothetical protein [Plasticicumulans sp.]